MLRGLHCDSLYAEVRPRCSFDVAFASFMIAVVLLQANRKSRHKAIGRAGCLVLLALPACVLGKEAASKAEKMADRRLSELEERTNSLEQEQELTADLRSQLLGKEREMEGMEEE